MAKKKRTVRPTKVIAQQVIAEEVPKQAVEAGAEMGVACGRFANLIQCTIGPEDFCLDFFARIGAQAVLTARVFITPTHAERVVTLLQKQIAKHKELKLATAVTELVKTKK